MAKIRDNWGSRATFILAAAGSAIGLGNIWKFPYMVGNNGGFAFLLMYLIIVFVVGFSVLLAEFAIGRAGQGNAVQAFRTLGKKYKIIGYLCVIVALFMASFYAPVAGWALKYMIWSISGLFTDANASIGYEKIFGAYMGMKDVSTGNTIQGLSSFLGSSPAFAVIILLISLVIIQIGIKNGIGKVNTVLMPLLFGIIIILVIRGLTLKGGHAGIVYYLTPHFKEGNILVNLLKVSTDALTHAFFSLSIGYGIMLTYASYMSKEDSIVRSATWVVVLDTLIAFLAGLMIFPAVFAYHLEPTQGPGLVFSTMPTLFKQMAGGTIFAFLFFLALTFAAITSLVSILEVVITFAEEEWKLSRKVATWAIGIVVIILAVLAGLGNGPLSNIQIVGKGIFDFYDYIAEALGIPFVGTCISLFAGWIMFDRLEKELTNNGQLSYGWMIPLKWTLRIISPAVCIYAFITGSGLWSLVSS